MTFEEALRIIDGQVFAKIGRRLTPVEKIALEAAWENEGYDKVASKSKYEPNYLRGQVAPKLWVLLSPIIGNGTKVTKKRLRSILEQTQILPAPQLPKQIDAQEAETTIPTAATETPAQLPTPVTQLQIVQGQPLSISDFHGREVELNQLKQLVFANRCIVVYGPAGIGKSALVAKLVTEIDAGLAPSFDCIVWKSVCYAPSLESLTDDLLKALPRGQSMHRELPSSVADKTSLLIESLQTSRCLIVLDEAEAWLQGDRNKSFHTYGEKYGEYGIFLRRLAEEKHHSCVVLTSQEPFKDVIKLQHSGRPSYSLKVTGLDLLAAKAILRKQGLTDEHKWENLLEPYLGNPSAIKQVASKIDRFFGGNVAKFLNHKTALTSEVYRNILLQGSQPGRLTSLEKQILLYLVEKTVDTPVGSSIVSNFTQLVDNIQTKATNTVSLSGIMEAVDALDHRSLIVISKDPQTKELLLDLPELTKDYFKKRLKSLSVGCQEERGKLLNVASQLFDSPQTSENFAL